MTILSPMIHDKVVEFGIDCSISAPYCVAKRLVPKKEGGYVATNTEAEHEIGQLFYCCNQQAMLD